MKILHICLACFFPDNYSYQENMLPKFHKEQGHEVEVIASLFTFDKNGKDSEYPEAKQYINEYGIKVTRLNYKNPKKINRIYKRFEGLKKALEDASPDLIFIHGCQFADIDIIAEYARNHTVTIYVDNHADFSNSAKNIISRIILHGIVWKYYAHIIEPYTRKFYGVLPARVEFLKNVYGLPKDKCELLVMGADDDAVNAASKIEIKNFIRRKYNIKENDFLIITGGKIDKFKTQTLLLMKAVKNLEREKVKLIVFGSVTPELQEKVKELADTSRVQYIGWIQAKDSYKYFAAADLVVFPGRHSVFWEQVAAQGIPMLVKYWDGTTHIDLGGNVRFLKKDSLEEIQRLIVQLLDDPLEYEKMKKIAIEKGKRTFSYNDIAKRCIEYHI